MFGHSPDGVPLSVVYDDLLYYYVTNIQGDVVAILDATGAEVVTYTYDAWGNILTIGGSKATTLGQDNPLRYRGYVYDQETGLYYLQSRYYDPEMGRFISADSFTSTGQGFTGNNMFAYCGNNPVNYLDPEGQDMGAALDWWLSLFLPIAEVEPTIIGEVVVVIGAVVITIYIYSSTEDGSIFSATKEEPSVKTDEKGRPVVEPGQQPTEKDGYIAPKGGPKQGKTPDGKKGWVDRNGNIWVPQPTGSSSAHGGGHWDVQGPDGGYINVYPGGDTRGGQAPFPRIKIFS